MSHFDVAVIGGGLVGASFIRCMANSGLRILLIDRAPSSELYNAALDNRGIAIAYTTRTILTQLNLWPALAAKAFAIANVHVSEQGSFGFTKLVAASYGLPALGYVISASDLGAALIQDLDLLPDLTVCRPETVNNAYFDMQKNCWHIDLSKQQITANLVLAADGSNSSLRKMQALLVHEKDYQQTAIVTNVNIQARKIATAYERFTSQGVLALLPFGQQRMKCVWTVANSQVNELLQLSDADFLSRLQSSMGYRVGSIKTVELRKTFPIVHTYAEQIFAPGLVLLGNAANTLHPVAAQGFNLGIRDAVTLSQLLRQAVANKRAINDLALLQEYARQRAIDHAQTRQFCNHLVEVFAHQNTSIKTARGLGLIATQLIPQLRRRVLAKGLGTCV